MKISTLELKIKQALFCKTTGPQLWAPGAYYNLLQPSVASLRGNLSQMTWFSRIGSQLQKWKTG